MTLPGSLQFHLNIILKAIKEEDGDHLASLLSFKRVYTKKYADELSKVCLIYLILNGKGIMYIC